ncbi:WD40-repeat-containing domain protein [Phlebopus sp. FC_14]|nr:WD40-repeat-containing domain protein [Phlebopus sp. FC_14]
MSDLPPNTPQHLCAVPLLKRTPSRATISNGHSIRKRRRVSIASFDFTAELGVSSNPESALEETDADRFVTARSSTSIPLNTTPRTTRIAKSFGLVDDRVLASTEGSSAPFETKVRSLLRRSASELFNVPRMISSLSAKANLAARKHFVMALDGPGISRDPFAFPMAWSRSNCIGVAFKADVYYQNLETRAIVHLCRMTFADGLVHSVDWDGEVKPHVLALGTTGGKIRAWDALSRKQIADWSDDESSVGGMHWNGNVLAVGRKDGRVTLFDLRTPKEVNAIKGHKRYVHGVKWSPDGRHLATGDHSGVIHVWDGRANDYLTHNDRKLLVKHEGPVKAISWSPWQNGLIATGGGYPDGSIQIWDINKISATVRPRLIRTYTTTTSLHWSPHCKELLSTHGWSWNLFQGYHSQPPPAREAPTTPFTNSMTVHSYPSYEKIVSVVAHSAPIGHSCIGPDGCSVFTVSPMEETIKMFKVWSAPDDQQKGNDEGMSHKSTIR